MTDRPRRIYLAGPDVFLPNARDIARSKKEICVRHGLEGLFPTDNVAALNAETAEGNALIILDGNEALMQACDAVIANMTPFRGPGMDGGTAFEMGYVRALGKPVIGYINDARPYAERVKSVCRLVRMRGDGTLEDQDSLLIEDFGLTENLMMHGAVARSGLSIVVAPTAEAERYSSLAAFEICCERLAAFFRTSPV